MFRIAFYSEFESWEDWAARLSPLLPAIEFVDLMSDDAREADIALVWTPPRRRPHQRNIRLCLLYTSPSPRDRTRSRMPSSA